MSVTYSVPHPGKHHAGNMARGRGRCTRTVGLRFKGGDADITE